MIPFLLPVLLLPYQRPFALHDGDRVLFYGDSITDNQFYPQHVENYVLTRFPNMKVSFMNYGWSGDKVTGGGGGDIAKRLSRDVFPFKPTVVTIMLGMNDGQYRAWDESVFKQFATGYERILADLRDNGSPRVTLIQPSPFDDVTLPPSIAGGGYNVVMRRYSDYLATLASRVGATLADFNTPVVDLLTKAKTVDPDTARKLIQDRVHPGMATHLVLGNALLKSWNAPSLVSSTQIDAAIGKATTENAIVRDYKTVPGTLSWREMEGALPVYIDRNYFGVPLVLKCSTVFDDVNQEPLKITNLRSGTYELFIDGESQGKFTAQQFGDGINLAELNTPMMKQSASVANWTARRQYLRQTMWRGIAIWSEGLNLTQRDQAIRGLEKLEADIVDHQRQAAKPVWHSFKVVRSDSRVASKRPSGRRGG
jgi:lysophospholipase L1-like esterase